MDSQKESLRVTTDRQKRDNVQPKDGNGSAGVYSVVYERLGAEPEKTEATDDQLKGTDGQVEETQFDQSALGGVVPVDIPFSVKHKLVVRLQQILEDTCYKFGEREMQQRLKERGWGCAEAVELDTWMEEFLDQQGIFQKEDDDGSKSVEALFKSVADIRHVAVRRTYVCMGVIERFLKAAEELMCLLKVGRYVEVIKRLRLDLESIGARQIQDAYKVHLQGKRRLLEIAEKRVVLEELETRVKEEVDKDMGKSEW
ncbi:hypothetical protein BGZ63DRAFT_429610 [Mariannaea sp. PMI_226]|nr:hypothetical protein BGZ63DRAFT_429610 [Mariannaea sp. PMI_226]